MINITKDAKFKLPRHRKSCAYQTSDGKDFCNCAAKFHGKPFAHWQRMAQKDVVDELIRTVVRYADPYCLPKLLAAQQLWNMVSEYPDIVEEVLAERARCAEGFAAIMQEITSGAWLPYFDPSAVGFPDNRDESLREKS